MMLRFVFKYLVLPSLFLLRVPFLFLLVYMLVSISMFWSLFFFLSFLFFNIPADPWLFSHHLVVRYRIAVWRQFGLMMEFDAHQTLTVIWSSWYPHLFAHMSPSH